MCDFIDCPNNAHYEQIRLCLDRIINKLIVPQGFLNHATFPSSIRVFFLFEPDMTVASQSPYALSYLLGLFSYKAPLIEHKLPPLSSEGGKCYFYWSRPSLSINVEMMLLSLSSI